MFTIKQGILPRSLHAQAVHADKHKIHIILCTQYIFVHSSLFPSRVAPQPGDRKCL